MDPLDLGPPCATLARLVTGVRDDQLGGPTPCPAYSVADLVDHVDGLALAFTAAARKDLLPGGSQATGDGSRLAGPWRERVAGRLADLAEAWRDPAAYAGTTMAGPVELPGDQAALVALDEVVVHGWDLARALGTAYDADPAAVEACLGFVSSFELSEDDAADTQDDAAFGTPVPVPADAPALDRLVGATGRDPGWALPQG